MKIIKNRIIEGKHNKSILIDLFYKQTQKAKPIVIFAHGYKGFKDWGCWNLIAEQFAEQNFLFVKFNFSYNGGTIDNPIDFSDLDAFGENNFTKELDDLQSVIDWILDDSSVKNDIDTTNIILIGHSRGGGIITLKANEDKRITQLITWAGVSDFGSRFPKGEILETWKKNGVSYIENTRTKQQMPHYYQFYEDFIINKERLHIETAAKKLTIPHLIIHGTDDTTVPFIEAENLHSWSSKSTLFPLKNANHTFGSVHPYLEKRLPSDFQRAVNQSIVFVKNQ